MTRQWLLTLQLPLLFVPGLFIGLVTYGSNFEVLAGYLYIVILIGLPLLAALLSRKLTAPPKPVAELVLLALGAATAAAVYLPLHSGYWHEASTAQALRIAACAVMLLLCSLIGAARILRNSSGDGLAAALLVIALCWLPALVYPLVPFLACALICLLGLTLPPTAGETVRTAFATGNKRPGDGWLRYGLFLIVLEFILVALDYQGETIWALHIAGGLVAAALGSRASGSTAGWLIAGAAISATLAACLWPPFVLHPAHSLILGMVLGWAIARLCLPGAADASPGPRPALLISGLHLWLLGLLVAQIFYSNLVVAHYRGLLLLPLLWCLFNRLRQSR